TATHLLHQALRTVLGAHVKQMGSDITPERTRFDFTHPAKLTPEEIQKIQTLVNDVIARDLPVTVKEMPYEEAAKSGALAFFKEKYPERVTVYSIGDFSREFCGGPHVSRTGEIGRFHIIKEESSSSGVRRIRATVE
ncbi:MAG: alanine--tRNA ligase, partial [Parcubacteria group bacterium]|nr:alanine--tRNA ligase [Parcubacteria group bacterium]